MTAWYNENNRSPIRRCIHSCHMPLGVYDENKNPSCSICRSKMFINRTPVKKTSIKTLIESEIEIEQEADDAEPSEELLKDFLEN